MIIEIIGAFTSVNYISSVTSAQVLAWVKWVGVKRAQIAILESDKDNKELDAIQSHEP